MAYYSAEEMKAVLEENPELREYLYCRGFLLTSKKVADLAAYPFYGNWKEELLPEGLWLYTHKSAYSYILQNGENTLFLVGHAYDPYAMVWEENQILADLQKALEQSEELFWEKESELTGVFCIGFIRDGKLTVSTDCCGMQLTYHGIVKNEVFVTSHAKLVADLCGLKQGKYITRLVNGRFWHYWGTYLPGDLSPFEELRRTVPNNKIIIDIAAKSESAARYYPTKEVKEVKTSEEYEDVIRELGRVMHNTMEMISRKWPEKKVSISVTGGRDSMTALSCANGLYDKFSYFSYISNYPESVDAVAAKKICDHLGLEHEVYTIPEESEDYANLDAFEKVMACNHGCIGNNNRNDLKKRLWFIKHPQFDMEVKSWVNEMGRAWFYNKYNKKNFPNRPTAKYWRAMHKVYVTPYLMRETRKVFQNYLDTYYSEEVFSKISWLELFGWEFTWSSGEGVFLTSEHKASYDITIPFNNRKYLELMLTVPLEKRVVDDIPIDLITYMNKAIADTGITVKDVQHTNARALLVRTYLEIFSRI